jgi:hypothetical protein
MWTHGGQGFLFSERRAVVTGGSERARKYEAHPPLRSRISSGPIYLGDELDGSGFGTNIGRGPVCLVRTCSDAIYLVYG